MTLKREIPEGEVVPWYYGMAWRNYANKKTVCYPIPLNRIIKLLLQFWIWLREPKDIPAMREAWQAGVDWQKTNSRNCRYCNPDLVWKYYE